METPEEALKRQYRALCLEFARGIAPKMAELEAGIRHLETAADADGVRAALGEIEAAAHRLAGGGATFGYPAISQAAVPVDSTARKLGRAPALSAADALEALRAPLRALRTATADPGEPQLSL